MVQVGKKHRVKKVLNESVLTWQDNPAATELQDVMLLVHGKITQQSQNYRMLCCWYDPKKVKVPLSWLGDDEALWGKKVESPLGG